MYFGAPLKQAVETGAVPMARLDGMVTNILTGMIENGVLDAPMPAAAQPIDYDAHAEVAQRDAEAGIVLLRNDGDVLPLATTAKRIVLLGGHAVVGVLSGGGSRQVRPVGRVAVWIPLAAGGEMGGAWCMERLGPFG